MGLGGGGGDGLGLGCRTGQNKHVAMNTRISDYSFVADGWRWVWIIIVVDFLVVDVIEIEGRIFIRSCHPPPLTPPCSLPPSAVLLYYIILCIYYTICKYFYSTR